MRLITLLNLSMFLESQPLCSWMIPNTSLDWIAWSIRDSAMKTQTVGGRRNLLVLGRKLSGIKISWYLWWKSVLWNRKHVTPPCGMSVEVNGGTCLVSFWCFFFPPRRFLGHCDASYMCQCRRCVWWIARLSAGNKMAHVYREASK